MALSDDIVSRISLVLQDDASPQFAQVGAAGAQAMGELSDAIGKADSQIAGLGQSIDGARGAMTSMVGQMQQMATQMSTAADRAVNASTGFDTLGKSATEAGAKLTAAGTEAEAAGAKASTAGDHARGGSYGFIDAAKQVGLYYAAYKIGSAVLSLATVQDARAYQDALTHVKAFTQPAGESVAAYGKQVQQWGAFILQEAPKLGLGIQSSAQGLYQLASAGIKASDVQTVLTGGMKLAAASGTDLGTVLSAVIPMYNSYHLHGQQVTAMLNDLAEMTNRSTAEFAQWAPELGMVTAEADHLNVPIKTLAAVLITLNNNGLSAAESVTQLNNMLRVIDAPGAKAIKTADSLGLSWKSLFDVQRDGLIPTLQKFADLMDASGHSADWFQQNLGVTAAQAKTLANNTGTADEMIKSLFGGNSVAMRAFFSTFTGGTAALHQNLQAMQNDSHALQAALNEALTSPQAHVDQLKSKLDEIRIKIETGLLPTVDAVVTHTDAWAGMVDKNLPAIEASLGTLVSKAKAAGTEFWDALAGGNKPSQQMQFWDSLVADIQKGATNWGDAAHNLQKIQGDLAGNTDTNTHKYASGWTDAGNIVHGVLELNVKDMQLWGQVVEAVTATIEQSVRGDITLWQGFTGAVHNLASTASQWGSLFLQGWGDPLDAINKKITDIGHNIGLIPKTVQDPFSSWGGTLDNLLGKVGNLKDQILGISSSAPGSYSGPQPGGGSNNIATLFGVSSRAFASGTSMAGIASADQAGLTARGGGKLAYDADYGATLGTGVYLPGNKSAQYTYLGNDAAMGKWGNLEYWQTPDGKGVIALPHLANLPKLQEGKTYSGGTYVGVVGTPEGNTNPMSRPTKYWSGPHLSVIADTGAAQYLGNASPSMPGTSILNPLTSRPYGNYTSAASGSGTAVLPKSGGGHQVVSTTSAPASIQKAFPSVAKYWPQIVAAAKAQHEDPYVLASLMAQESGGNINAPATYNAPEKAWDLGLFQYGPSEAASVGGQYGPHVSAQNQITTAAKILKEKGIVGWNGQAEANSVLNRAAAWSGGPVGVPGGVAGGNPGAVLAHAVMGTTGPLESKFPNAAREVLSDWAAKFAAATTQQQITQLEQQFGAAMEPGAMLNAITTKLQDRKSREIATQKADLLTGNTAGASAAGKAAANAAWSLKQISAVGQTALGGATPPGNALPAYLMGASKAEIDQYLLSRNQAKGGTNLITPPGSPAALVAALTSGAGTFGGPLSGAFGAIQNQFAGAMSGGSLKQQVALANQLAQMTPGQMLSAITQHLQGAQSYNTQEAVAAGLQGRTGDLSQFEDNAAKASKALQLVANEQNKVAETIALKSGDFATYISDRQSDVSKHVSDLTAKAETEFLKTGIISDATMQKLVSASDHATDFANKIAAATQRIALANGDYSTVLQSQQSQAQNAVTQGTSRTQYLLATGKLATTTVNGRNPFGEQTVTQGQQIDASLSGAVTAQAKLDKMANQADIVSEHFALLTGHLSQFTSALQDQQSRATDRVATSIYQGTSVNPADINAAAAALVKLNKAADANAEADLLVAEKAGDTAKTMSDLSQIISTQLTKAESTAALSILKHGQATAQDTAAIEQAAQAQARVTDANQRAAEIATESTRQQTEQTQKSLAQIDLQYGDFSGALQKITGLFQGPVDQAAAKLTLDFLKLSGATEGDIKGLEQAMGSLNALTLAQAKTAEVQTIINNRQQQQNLPGLAQLDLSMGDLSGYMTKTGQMLQTNVGDASAKVAYDLYTHSGSLSADEAALRVAEQALDAFTNATNSATAAQKGAYFAADAAAQTDYQEKLAAYENAKKEGVAGAALQMLYDAAVAAGVALFKLEQIPTLVTNRVNMLTQGAQGYIPGGTGGQPYPYGSMTYNGAIYPYDANGNVVSGPPSLYAANQTPAPYQTPYGPNPYAGNTSYLNSSYGTSSAPGSTNGSGLTTIPYGYVNTSGFPQPMGPQSGVVGPRNSGVVVADGKGGYYVYSGPGGAISAGGKVIPITYNGQLDFSGILPYASTAGAYNPVFGPGTDYNFQPSTAIEDWTRQSMGLPSGPGSWENVNGWMVRQAFSNGGNIDPSNDPLTARALQPLTDWTMGLVQRSQDSMAAAQQANTAATIANTTALNNNSAASKDQVEALQSWFQRLTQADAADNSRVGGGFQMNFQAWLAGLSGNAQYSQPSNGIS